MTEKPNAQEMVTSPKSRDCRRCGKPLTIARLRSKKIRCGPCDLIVKREQKESSHDRMVCRVYGLRPGEYRKLYDAQNGRCAIHGCKARGLKVSLAVDHDHKKTGREAIRGLLCKRHNRFFGYNSDNPEAFDSMATYLRDPPAPRVLNLKQGE